MTCKTHLCLKSTRQILSPYADDCEATGNSTSTVNDLGVTHHGLLSMTERGKAEHRPPTFSPFTMAKHWWHRSNPSWIP